MDLESVRSELRALRDQESQLPFDSSHRERRALQARGKTLIVNAGLWGVDKDEYARWLDGDLKGRPKMRVDFKPASSPSGYASAASAAASSAPLPLRNSATSASPPPRTPRSLEVSTAYVAGAKAAQAAGRAQASVQISSGSRAAAAAEIHIGPINASRKRCGLPPLTAAELTHEFADLDRHPAPTAYVAGARAAQAAGRPEASVQISSGSRAAAAAEIHIGPINASRKRCGLPPLTTAELTHEFADLDRHPTPAKGNRRDAGNAIVARQGGPVTPSDIDKMWAGIAAKRNAPSTWR